MLKAPSTLTAIAMLAVFLCLKFNSSFGACTECICFQDKTCTNEDCGAAPNANCSRTVFSPACTGNYTITTLTTCPDEGDCGACQSCAHLFQLDGVNEYAVTNGNCHTTGCTGGNCFYNCSATGNYVNLDATKTYVMYVCKVPCPGGHSCEDCNENCAAYVCLSYGVMTCAP